MDSPACNIEKQNEKRRALLGRIKLILPFAAVAAAGYSPAADAAWYFGGVLVSNVCRAPSGAVWYYPAAAAQPLGTVCTILPTGEAGVVTAN